MNALQKLKTLENIIKENVKIADVDDIINDLKETIESVESYKLALKNETKTHYIGLYQHSIYEFTDKENSVYRKGISFGEKLILENVLVDCFGMSHAEVRKIEIKTLKGIEDLEKKVRG